MRVQLEATRDGVHTTKAAVMKGFPLEKLVELKRMKSEDDKKRGKEEQWPFFACLCLVGLWRGMVKRCALTEDVRTWWR